MDIAILIGLKTEMEQFHSGIEVVLFWELISARLLSSFFLSFFLGSMGLHSTAGFGKKKKCHKHDKIQDVCHTFHNTSS